MGKLKFHIGIINRGIKIMFKIERKYILLTIITCILSALIPFVPVYFSAKLLDEIYISSKLVTDGRWSGQNLDKVINLTCLTIGVLFILTLINSILKRNKDFHANQFSKNEKMLFSKKAMEMKYEYLEDRDISILNGKIERSSQSGYNIWMLHHTFGEIITHTTTFITSLTFISVLFIDFNVDLKYKLIVVAIMFLIIINGFFCTAKTNNLFNKMFNQWGELNLWSNFYDDLLKNYNAGKDIRIFNLDKLLEKKHKKINQSYLKEKKKTNKKQIKYIILNNVWSYVFQMVAYFYAIYVCLLGNISIGEIAANVSYMLMFTASINSLIKMIQDLLNNNKYLCDYYKYIDLAEMTSQNNERIDMEKEYEIEFKNVSFCYPSTNTFILKNINVKLSKRKKTAIVGLNGSGKTTFIKLLCGLYQPTEGEILLNGINIRRFNNKEYLRLFSTVYQDFKLFSFTLGQNVAVSYEYDMDKVETNLNKVGVMEKFIKTPDRLETYLYKDFSKEGYELSGGEGQKVAMARALYRDSPFIILDEPTAAMDPISEVELYTNFDKIMSDKTTIYISHRLASCKFCDTIMVFHEGEIIQEGSHDALVEDISGMYYKMWESQAKYYLEKEN